MPPAKSSLVGLLFISSQEAGRADSLVLRAAVRLPQYRISACLDGSNVGLTIYGVDDSQVLGRADSQDIVASWSGTIPTTQDYIIRVSPVVDRTTYALTVLIQ